MLKHSKLAFKFVMSFLLLGVCICAASSVIGYQQYKSSIEKQYNDVAYQCAEVAISYIDLEDMKVYVEASKSEEASEAVQKSEAYQTAKTQIETLRAAMGANDILIVTLDQQELLSYDGNREGWEPLTYIFDSYTIEELSFSLGEKGGFNPEYIKELNQIATTGERVDNYFFSESDFGYNTAALLPIMDGDQVIAIIAVEIPMTTLQSSLHQYIVYAVLVTVILIVLFISIYMVYFYRNVISPINFVAACAEGFVNHENQISEDLMKIDSRDEIQYLADSILKMQHDIREHIKNLALVTAEKERIGAELDIAAKIQADMLPCIFPAFPERKEIDIYATMHPAKEVGGDFYDFFMVDDRHLAIVMADVSGKGVPAALFMVIGKTLIKDHTQPGRDLGDVFTEVNELLCESNSEGLFITAFEGVLDLVTGEFRFVNAGHEVPFLCKKGGTFEPYKIRSGFVLAGMEGMRYKSGVMQLEPGDKIFQYTDGVTEATNHQEELYGMERLTKVLQSHTEVGPMELLPAIQKDIESFVGDAVQFDDITMLCLEYRERMEEQE